MQILCQDVFVKQKGVDKLSLDSQLSFLGLSCKSCNHMALWACGCGDDIFFRNSFFKRLQYDYPKAGLSGNVPLPYIAWMLG